LQFLPRLDGFAILAEFRKGQDAFGFEANVQHQGVGRNRDHGTFPSTLRRFGRVALFKLRKNAAEGFGLIVALWSFGI
jgi:hypothetical protein